MNILRGLAANFIDLPFSARTVLFALCAALLLLFVCRIGLRWALWLILNILRYVLRVLYFIVGRVLLERLMRFSSSFESAYDGFSSFMENIDRRLGEDILRLRAKREGKHTVRNFILFLLLAGGITLVLQLPNLLGGIVNASYLDSFRLGETAYLAFEENLRAFEAGAERLIEVAAQTPEPTPTTRETASPTPSPTPRKECTVATRGGQKANVRSEPNDRSAIMAKVDNGTSVIDLEQREGNWIYIETNDGILGWIHNSLLSDLDND